VKRKLVIFGIEDAALLAHRYFGTDSDYSVTAFTVDRDFLPADGFCGLPVVAFDEVAKVFPPSQHDFFVALGYTQLNRLRKEKYLAAKAAGYTLASYLSSHATILNDGRIGDNCFILEDNTIQPFATIGANVTLWSGNHIGHHSVIGDHCFLASHIVVSGHVEIQESCFIGVNATIRDHVTIGARCIVGAGSVILSNVDAEGIYGGTASERSKVPSSRLKKI
jgi:sugar O-acyltransferase (sialic acid O-acetyltransferase NeuD family)